MNVAKMAAAPMFRMSGMRWPISAHVKPKKANTTMAMEISDDILPVATKPAISPPISTKTGSGTIPMRSSISFHHPSGQNRPDALGAGTETDTAFVLSIGSSAHPESVRRPPLRHEAYLRCGCTRIQVTTAIQVIVHLRRAAQHPWIEEDRERGGFQRLCGKRTGSIRLPQH